MDTSSAVNIDPADTALSTEEPGLDEKLTASSAQTITDDVTSTEISSIKEEATREAIDKISSAIKSDYFGNLNKASGRVKELIHNQEVLQESIQQEMTNLNEYKLTEDITEFVTELRNYHSKLKSMKKDIQYINDKVSKMKRRATKLRTNREKEERQAEENKRKELELQQKLTAKPAPTAESLDP